MARRTAAKERIARLTPREREVLSLLGAGLSNAEIGRRLFLAEGTVKALIGWLDVIGSGLVVGSPLPDASLHARAERTSPDRVQPAGC